MLIFSIHNVILLKSSITVVDFYLHMHGADMSPSTFRILYSMDVIFALSYVIAGTLLAVGIHLVNKAPENSHLAI